MPFDNPTDADLEDPGRMWLDQLSGRRNFEPCSFMGFINDLLLFEREDWRGLFADLPNGAGFVAKLSDFSTTFGSHTQTGMLTPAQLKAARALVGWSRDTLAKKAGVSAPTVTGFELLGADSKVSTVQKMRRALEVAGVEFIDEGARSEDGGPGVRLLRGAKTKR